ncbi:xanthine dehydrogenase/oxidase-like [Littorina saxatilis]|uniref:Xanthine dehydrogenase n=1 Tax=Littorina saxatilis TaxID=31220 RepID=A0AAN9BEL5_9CAEN
MVLEQYKVRPDGMLLTRGPGNYKIPSVGNISQTFNVTLLPESGNTKAVYSSKGIGEPPILLAASVMFAIREAVTSARVDADLDPHFRFDTPATPHRIRMACGDQFTKKLGDSSAKVAAEPWFVDL